MSDWKPSKRASEGIGAMWDAFYEGDRWLRCRSRSTANKTVESLRFNRWAEVDPDDPRRFRLSEEMLNLNGLTRRVPLFAGLTLNELSDL